MKATAAVLLSVSCGGSTTPAQCKEAAAPPPPPPAQLAIPCPQGDALLAIARVALGAPTAESIGEPRCIALRNRRGARWIIDGYVTGGEEDAAHVGVVAATSGRVLSTVKDAIRTGNGGRLEAFDLDGDGDDELLVWDEEFGDASLKGELHVLALQGDKLVDVAQLPYADTRGGVPDVHEEFAQCRAQHFVIEGPKSTKRIELIGGEGDGDVAGLDCPEPGRHVYGFVDKAFREVER